MKAAVLIATVSSAFAHTQDAHRCGPNSGCMRSMRRAAVDDPAASYSRRQLRHIPFPSRETKSGENTNVGGDYIASQDYSKDVINESNNFQDHRDFSEENMNNSKSFHDISKTVTDESYDGSQLDVDAGQKSVNTGEQINGDDIGHTVNID